MTTLGSRPASKTATALPPIPGAPAPVAQIPVAQSRAELARTRAALQGPVSVVMTMGALHAGHAALIRTAASYGRVLVTIFVNPLQFGPNEDLERYPRTLGADLELCAEAGADLVFAPTPDVMYPSGEPLVRVDPGPGGMVLEGASRPGHFAGVLTVVAKLLNLTRPDRAFFGEKDFQQLTLIRQMVRDLDMPVEIIGVPTWRDADGLAMSSRNRYLSKAQSPTALTLSQALAAGVAASPRGREAVLEAARDLLTRAPGLTIDRLDLVDPISLADATHGPARLLVAAILPGSAGPIRLIDNAPLTLGMD
ncbi:MAG: pantoate--beta-alanine ligase [Mycobacterium sp.]|nr:pantoate--beta-alanine ligase [Mycobacterium sp.]